MPKILTPAMRAHLDAETTRLAAIWRITRKEGQQFFFTDHDRDSVFRGRGLPGRCRVRAHGDQTGGEPLTPVSGIEKSKIIIPKVDFD
jgi:hypothetical protein